MSRLEDIKRDIDTWLRWSKNTHFAELDESDMKEVEWLYQQAEEKQELETMIESQNNVIGNLEQQNKRYEIALKEIIEIWNRPYGDTDAKDMKMVAKQALQNK